MNNPISLPPFQRPFQGYPESLVLHLLLLIAGGAYEWMRPPGVEEKTLALIKSSMRVDIQAMPRATLKELQALDPSQSSVESIPPKKTQKSQDAKEKDFKSFLKGLSQKKVAFNKPKKKYHKGDLKQLLYAGNRLQKGAPGLHEGGREAQGQFEEYIIQLPDLVRPHWKLPSYLLSQDLKCRIKIYINGRGEVVKTQVIEESGGQEFDQKALRSIGQASPFPPPGRLIVSRLLKEGVILGFPL